MSSRHKHSRHNSHQSDVYQSAYSGNLRPKGYFRDQLERESVRNGSHLSRDRASRYSVEERRPTGLHTSSYHPQSATHHAPSSRADHSQIEESSQFSHSGPYGYRVQEEVPPEFEASSNHSRSAAQHSHPPYANHSPGYEAPYSSHGEAFGRPHEKASRFESTPAPDAAFGFRPLSSHGRSSLFQPAGGLSVGFMEAIGGQTRTFSHTDAEGFDVKDTQAMVDNERVAGGIERRQRQRTADGWDLSTEQGRGLLLDRSSGAMGGRMYHFEEARGAHGDYYSHREETTVFKGTW